MSGPSIPCDPVAEQAETIESASQAGLEWPALLEALGERLSTEYGRQALKGLARLAEPEAVRRSLSIIAEMEALHAEESGLDFAALPPIGALLARAEKAGLLDLAELMTLLQTMRTARALGERLEGREESPLLAELAGELELLPELSGRLERALTLEGELSEQEYSQLVRPRQELVRRRKSLKKRLDELLRSRPLAKAFQEKIHTLRGSRHVVPVKADFRGLVPGIVHDISASGATLFIEPQAVVEESNAIKLVERRLEELSEQIRRELTAAIGAQARPLRDNLIWLGRLDLLQAQASLSRAYGGCAPEVDSGGRLALIKTANPLMLLKGAAVVRNDVEIPEECRGLVVSGANTGGKTVLLKTVGLCALLTGHGMPIPAAPGSRCGLYVDILADIGDRQSISLSLSTFSAQVQFVVEALKRATPGSLILIDEIMTATAPQEGAALAATILEELAARGVRTIVTTHFGELKELAASNPSFSNASMAFDGERMRPTYHLVSGTPGASFAFPIAKRWGLAEELTEKAEQMLAHRPAAAEALMAQLQNRQLELREEARELAEKTAGENRRESELSGREAELKQREQQLRRREKGAIGNELKEARLKIAAVIADLQGANSLPLAGRLRKRLDEVGEELQPTPPPEEAPPPAPMKPGETVLLLSNGRPVTLETLLDGGRRARVRLGALTMEVESSELAPRPPGEQPRPGPASRRGERGKVPKKGRKGSPAGSSTRPGPTEEIRLSLPTQENSLDLRGLRLEEALERCEKFFDQCVMKQVSPVLLIHGHGTGKLKSGLRSQLPQSPYVTGFRPGEKGEGWDGVTVVALNL